MIILSNDNRDEWFTQRVGVITATLMSSLYTGTIKGWTTAAKKFYRDEHREFVSDAAQWGHDREPFLVKWMQEEYPEYCLEHNESLILSDYNKKFGATPDSIGTYLFTDVVTGEIKTVGTDIYEKDFISKPHMRQVQWQLAVTDADVCLFACEERREPATHLYECGKAFTMFIDRDEKMIEGMFKVGEQFLKFVETGDYPTDRKR